ncbi:hypothetical protein [Planctomycetes bacterium TBK1r]|uniref:Uncharacterized protein n=1 Tax=Stieleria magnilauensis TaxID=2527963 RepID=A0ABX5XUR3_9BACT|nr:hypothetical protein TBK1r_47840 [Planctomycetes bacterium TBK1r]
MKKTKRQIFHRTELVAIIAHVVILLSTMFWIFWDPKVANLVDQIGHEPTFRTMAVRPISLCLVGVIAMVVSAWPIVRSRRFTLRFGLWNCLVAAIACGLFVNRDNIQWLGYRWRAASHVRQLDALAERLYLDWPSEDGEIDGLGPFTSYPFGQPRVLLLLNPYPVASTDTVVAAVERSDNRSLLFQLGGTDAGVWLHWSREGSVPQEYVSGLEENRLPSKYATLSTQWHVVAYGES